MEHLLYRVLQILPLVQRLQQVIMSCRQNTSRWLEKVEDIQVNVNNAVVTELWRSWLEKINYQKK